MLPGSSAGIGEITASGLPRRVTMISPPVSATSGNSERHFWRNSLIAMLLAFGGNSIGQVYN